MRKVIVALFFVFALPSAKAQSPTPKETVLAFYKLALSDMNPNEAEGFCYPGEWPTTHAEGRRERWV